MTPLLRARARYLASKDRTTRERDAFILAIRAEIERGRSYADVAGELGMDRSNVFNLCRELD